MFNVKIVAELFLTVVAKDIGSFLRESSHEQVEIPAGRNSPVWILIRRVEIREFPPAGISTRRVDIIFEPPVWTPPKDHDFLYNTLDQVEAVDSAVCSASQSPRRKSSTPARSRLLLR